MTTGCFNLDIVHPSWQACIKRGLSKMDPRYLDELNQSSEWLPGPRQIFNAFSMPIDKVQYVLFGESPYPRAESANGFAFWDASVKDLWSPTGLSKQVNRATSLRNILKMMLIANGSLPKTQTSQDDIAKLNKNAFVQTNDGLFNNFLEQGFLLLNATPVLQADAPQKDARAWLPFTAELLSCLLEKKENLTFILLGRIAQTIDPLIGQVEVNKLYSEHPYNVSFITNDKILDFFRPLELLKKP